jgi:hypothetical protein
VHDDNVHGDVDHLSHHDDDEMMMMMIKMVKVMVMSMMHDSD